MGKRAGGKQDMKGITSSWSRRQMKSYGIDRVAVSSVSSRWRELKEK